MSALLVNLPAERGKRSHFGRLNFQNGTNFGLLAIASAAHEQGHSVELFDPRTVGPHYDQTPDLGLDEFRRVAASRSWSVIGFSCLSGFSYPALEVWSASAREACPTAFLVAGGQDHVGKMPGITLADNPALDAVAIGEGERTLSSLLSARTGQRDLSSIVGLATRQRLDTAPAPTPGNLPSLRYQLYPDLGQMPASVEFARGCPFGCDFCTSARTGFRRRDPADLAQQIDLVTDAYGLADLPIYLEAPIFVAPRSYLSELQHSFDERHLKPLWRTESRVDAIDPSNVELLAACGLRVIDLGLESASPSILGLMNKARDVSAYLRKASKLLKELAGAGIFVKVNVLFYAGETNETIAETVSFLELHRPFIGAVSAYPLMLYPGMDGEARIRTILFESGGSIVEHPDWARRRLYPVNVSRSLSYEDLLGRAHKLEQEFQDMESYFYQRRFGYFRPDVTFEEFLAAVSLSDVDIFPFRTDRGGISG